MAILCTIHKQTYTRTTECKNKEQLEHNYVSYDYIVLYIF